MEIPVNHHEILGSSDEIPNFCKETSPWILFVSSLLVGRHSPFQLIICYASPFLATNQPVSWYHPSFVGPLSNKVGMIYIYIYIYIWGLIQIQSAIVGLIEISYVRISNVRLSNIIISYVYIYIYIYIYIGDYPMYKSPNILCQGFSLPRCENGRNSRVGNQEVKSSVFFKKKWFSFAHKTARASLSIEYPLVN